MKMEKYMAVKETIPPTNPLEIEKLNKIVEACVQDMTSIKMAQERMRETVKETSEEHQITVKHLNKMIKTKFNEDYDSVIQDDEMFQLLYETVLGDDNS